MFGTINRLVFSAVESAQPDYKKTGWFGLSNFLLFYFVWEYLYPQPYESLLIRSFGSAIALPLVLADFWPTRMQRFLPYYWYFSIGFVAYFFSYMVFRNDFNYVWMMSFLAGFLLVIIHINWLNALILFTIGLLIAMSQSVFVHSFELPRHALRETPFILGFALTGGILLNWRALRVQREKIKAMSSMAGEIAHEIQAPIQAIEHMARAMRNEIQILVQTYAAARKKYEVKGEIVNEALDLIPGTMDKISIHAGNSVKIIDLFLANAGRVHFEHGDFKRHDLSTLVARALKEYPYRLPEDARLVTFKRQEGIHFFGSDALMLFVLVNLLRNSFRSIQEAGRGEITVSLSASEEQTLLQVHDTGTGVDPVLLPFIFELSTSAIDGRSTRLGLAFCKRTVESFGGSITCDSESGRFAQFNISLPRVL